MKDFELAFPGPLRDQLVAAVLRGDKTTTSGLLVDYEHCGDPLPEVGARERMVDSAGEGVAVIETTEVRYLRLSEVDRVHAKDEGEGFTTVAEWRDDHEKFWHSKEFRDSIDDPEFTVDDDTVVVTVRFRVVERVTA